MATGGSVAAGAPVIGISIGTTNMSVGVYRNNRIDIIGDERGERRIPAVISFTDKGHVVGQHAVDQLVSNPQNTITGTKWMIGRSFHDIDAVLCDRTFKLCNSKPMPVVTVAESGFEKQYTAEQLFGLLLKKAKETADTFLSLSISHAVVSIPSSYSQNQRTAVQSAAESIGFQSVALVDEEKVVIDAHGVEHADSVLVFHCGGRTTSVAGSAQNLKLGGSNFDDSLISYCCELFEEENDMIMRNNTKSMHRLSQAVEKAKIKLSKSPDASIYVSSIFKGKDFSAKFLRSQFDDLCRELFEEAAFLISEAMYYAKVDKDMIHSVVLTGGSCSIPALVQQVKLIVGKDKIISSEMFPADLAIIHGTVIHSALIAKPRHSEKDMKIQPLVSELEADVKSVDYNFNVVVQPKDVRHEAIISSLQYALSLHDMLHKQPFVSSHELESMHKDEVKKFMDQLKNQKRSVNESELQEIIPMTFRNLTELNSKTQKLTQSSLKSLKEEHLLTFSRQFETCLYKMQEIDLQKVNNQYWNLKAAGLRSFEADLKERNSPPAVTRKMKKDFQSDMDQTKTAMIEKRKEQISESQKQIDAILSAYINLMEQEFRRKPNMKEEEAAAISDKLIATHVPKEQNEQRRSELRVLLGKQFQILWSELQHTNKERAKSVETLVQNLRAKYKQAMTEGIGRRKLEKMAQLIFLHCQTLDQVVADLRNNADFKELGDYCMNVEPDLRENIADDYEEIRAGFKIKIDKLINELIVSCRKSYLKSMTGHLRKYPSNSLIDMRNAHLKYMQRQKDAILAHELVKTLPKHEKQQHYAKLVNSIESDYQKEQANFNHATQKREVQQKVDQELEISHAVFWSDLYYVLADMDKKGNVTRADVTSAHSLLKGEFISRFKSKAKDAPEDMITDAMIKLQAMAATDYDEMVKMFVGPFGVISDSVRRLWDNIANKTGEASGGKKPAAEASGKPEKSSDRYIRSYVTRVSDFIEKNPDASYLQKLREHNETLGEIKHEMRVKGIPESVIHSAEKGMEHEWKSLRNMRSVAHD